VAEMICGVDGGASKTHLALADRTGKLRAFVAGPGTNHEGRGMRPIHRIFKAMLDRACRAARCGPRDVAAGCFGLCGGDLPEDMAHIRKEAVTPLGFHGPSLVTNDAFIALFNDRWRDVGVAVTSGSWTKWLGMHGRRMFMHDGVGHLGIRLQATRELTRVHEGYREPSPFTAALLRFTGFASYAEYFNRTVYGDGKREYIRHTTPAQAEALRRVPEFLAARASRGDREALVVLGRYADELVEGVGAVVRRLGLRGTAHDLVLSGSVLNGNPILRRQFAARLKAVSPRSRIIPAAARPIRGALMYAAHLAGWTLPDSALRERALAYTPR
jgi:N-acetylglucosamine kinase-like BadF-type ATPase